MFTLTLYDRKGKPLKEGDIVRVHGGTNVQFYAEVKYLEKEQAIAPFHTFSFHSFEKVDKLPDNAVQSTEERYKIWYTHNPKTKLKENPTSKYLLDWRQCEHLLKDKCFRISKI